MQVILANNCGFCEGVARAVNTALTVSPDNAYVLGEIIHNEDVVSRITARGIRTVERLSEVPDGATLLIRSHGVGESIYEECKKKQVAVVDCTCPFVQRTQKIVKKASEEGKTVAIAGDRRHPEVEGLIGWCTGESFIFASEDEDFTPLREKKVVLVAQTTFSAQRFSKIRKNIQKECKKTVEVFETICYTTIGRQRDAQKLSALCDAVIVIGGKNSSNTEKLCEIASANCGHVYRLTGADGFKYEKIKFCNRVGVIAGASTPHWQIQEVLSKMAENNAEVLKTETVENVEAQETVSAQAEVKVAEAASAKQTARPKSAQSKSKKVMDDALEGMAQEKPFHNNEILSVEVVLATDTGIYVSVSGKGEILIDKADLDCEQYSRELYTEKVGQKIDVMVLATNPVKLSEKSVRKIREEEAVLKDIEDGSVFTVTCTGFNKGGLTAELGTYPVFIPAREIRSGFVKELDKYVGKTLRLKLIEIRRGRRKEIIASQRVILEAEKAEQEAARAAKEEAFFESIEVGQIVEGKVERATTFGAFVSVKGFDCLAHISDLSWTGVKEVKDVLEIGKRYEFQVLKIDKERRKVSIGYKQLQPQPWDTAAEKYAEGDIVHGKVVRIVPFGAFVEIEKGIDGLVHVSQISYEWLDNPTSVLQIGQEIDAKILAFSPAERKITLSIKALQDRPEPVYPEDVEEEQSRPRQKRNNRRNSRYDDYDDGDYREWNDSSYDGVSIGEMLGSDEDKK